MENNENLVIIPADLPEGSHIAKAPNRQQYIAVPISFEVPESVYRTLAHWTTFSALGFESVADVARSVVNGYANRILRYLLHYPPKEDSLE